jgi:hypothetical protein
MSAKQVKIYPIKGRWMHDHPAAVHIVETKAEADELIAGGAFTDNPNDAERDHDAPDLTAPVAEPAAVPVADQPVVTPTEPQAIEVPKAPEPEPA